MKLYFFIIMSLLISPLLHAEKLVIALGNFEPLFAKKDSPALFKDILDGIYSYMPDTTVSYHYMFSNARLVNALNNKSVDGAANIFSAKEISGCITQPVFKYSDIAISLKDKNLKINNVSDLKNLSIVSYQGAKVLLGTPYYNAVNNSLYYQEISNPKEQAKLLSEGMVDVSIGDKFIFLYTIRTWLTDHVDSQSFAFHNIFPPVYSSMGFVNQKHCDAFDEALIKFKASGNYEKTYQKHLKRLGYHTLIKD